MPSGTGIAPPRCHPPPDGGTLRHVNNSLPGPVSEGSVHGNGSRQPDNWLLALAEPFVTVLAHGNGVIYRHFGIQVLVFYRSIQNIQSRSHVAPPTFSEKLHPCYHSTSFCRTVKTPQNISVLYS